MKKIAGWIVDGRVFIFIVTIILVAASIFGMSQVNINYDMSKYLPNDSAVREGMKLMEQEYGEMAAVTVMFENLSPKEQTEHKEQMEKIEYVKNVIYLQQDENYQKGNYSKYILNISAGTYSKEAREVLKTLRNTYEDKALISGVAVDNDLMIKTLTEEIPVIAAVAVIIIFAILFLLCDSWIEPFLYMGCIGAAVLMNMGSNAWLPSVSFMTFAIGSLLQMGLSMDYSIMLMNRYGQEKGQEDNPAAAMKKALANSFLSISSSSLTTIAGLLVLLMMSFKIGQDMGVVLAKGVFISLICIFTILPGLVIMFDKLIMKTHKKSLNFKMDFIMKAVTKARFALILIVAVIVVFAVVLKGGLGIGYVKTFDNEDQAKIEDVFGIDNQIVLLYDHLEDKSKIAEYIGWLEGQDEVNSVQDYSNTIGKEYTYEELAKDMDMTESQAKMLYQMYRENQDTSEYEKITMYDLVCYLEENVAADPAYAEFMTAEQITQIKDAKKELENGKIKIADAEQEIKDGENELSDGEVKIADGEAQITKNERLLNESEKELKNGEAQIAESEKQISDGETQLAKAEANLAESEKQILAGEEQLAAARKQMLESGLDEETINAQLVQQEQALAEARQQLEAGKAELTAKKEELANGRKQLEAGKAELAAKKAELKEGRKQLEAGKAELAAKKQELADGRAKLESGKQELADGRGQLNNGYSQIAKAKQELEEGKQELADGRKELNDGKTELEESKEIYEKPMTAEELADVMEEDQSDVEEMLKIRRMTMLDVENDKMELEEFVDFIIKEVLTNETYADAVERQMYSIW